MLDRNADEPHFSSDGRSFSSRTMMELYGYTLWITPPAPSPLATVSAGSGLRSAGRLTGRFKAAISGAGSAFFSSFYGHDEYQRDYENELGHP